MNKNQQLIRDRLKAIAAEHGPDIFKDGTVVEVDADNYFADVLLDTGETYFECRLRAMVAGNQSVDVLPSVGSAVVIAKIIDDEYLVIACDKIDSYRITIGTTVFKLDATGALISKGNETLNKILNDMVQLIMSIGAYKDMPGLTAIKLRINDLLK